MQDGEHKELCGNNVARGLGFHCTATNRLARFAQKGPTRWMHQGSSWSPSKSFRMLGLSVLVSAKRGLQQVAEDTELDRECVKTLTRYFLGQFYVLQI